MPEEQQNVTIAVEKAIASLSLPQEKRAEVARVLSREIRRFHSGPLPDPDTLRQYAELIPNGAERIMGLVERQSTHRHTQEAKMVSTHAKLALTGQWIGGALAVLFGAAAFHLGMNGHDWLAGILGTSTICSLVAIFVLGRASESEVEPEEQPPTQQSDNKSIQPKKRK